MSHRIAIIGGGPAGFFAAISCAESAQEKKIPLPEIKVFEGSGEFLKKVRISGGGRCNVTHHCFEVRDFCQNYPRGQRELLSPMQQFQAKDTVQWFAQKGVQLVAEADGRMFPSTHNSETIVRCLINSAEKLGVKLLLNYSLKEIKKHDGGFELHFRNGTSYHCHSLMLATGSSKEGHQFARSLGHHITELAPSLFTFKIHDPLLEDLAGISFPQAHLSLNANGKTFEQLGPTLITHWGLSGPATLKLSAWAAREMQSCQYKAKLTVNWLNESDTQLRHAFEKQRKEKARSQCQTGFSDLLPKRFWSRVLEICSIPAERIWAELTRAETHALIETLCRTRLQISGKSRFKEEFVECGGVDLKEINFKTMESRICPGLFFAGETLDIDGITGGFNFQNAWSGGWIAGRNFKTPSDNYDL